ncbi:ferric reductase like transmembrane component-domain-containing protein [Umbelopsis sp. PMI_123]|nr:ferric reductase like transmembrane component-domain-containing protein [Umbelopsis sp. PMI_123]
MSDMSGTAMPGMVNNNSSPSSLTGGFNLTQIAGNYTAEYNFLQAMLDFSDFDPYNQNLALVYWYIIAGLIGFLTMVNAIKQIISYLRFRTNDHLLRKFGLDSDFHKGPLALLRTITYPQVHSWKSFEFPAFGDLLLILLYFALIIILVYVNVTVEGFQEWIAVAFRAGWITVAQLPLVILLAGKSNLIGYLTGTSYERLNILHRWLARIIFFTATLHMIYLYKNFSFYGLVTMEWDTDTCPPTGTAAWVLLFWIVISSISPIRNLRYEVFVIQHVVSYVGFIIALSYHIQPYTEAIWIYAWIPIGFFVLDRLIRLFTYIWNNVSFTGVQVQAELTPISGDCTMVSIQNSRIRSWLPGQHVLLSIPKCGLVQSHPFTIASVSSKNNSKLKFIIRAKQGFTSRLLDKAIEISASKQTVIASVNGPYGNPISFAQFRRVYLLTGGTGSTYTVPLLLELCRRSALQNVPCRHVTFMWAIKSLSQLSWFAEELREANDCASLCVDIQIYITGNEREPLESIRCVHNSDGKEEVSEAMEGGSYISDPQATSVSNDLLSSIVINYGRPVWSIALAEMIDTEDEAGVAVSGPNGLTADVRNEVAKIEFRRALRNNKTSGLYLHVENYGL